MTAKIHSYKKFISPEVTRTLNTFNGANLDSPVITELATIEGLTYVSVPDGVTLPADQPAEIADSIQLVELTDSLRDAIKAASPHIQLINQRFIERLRERYSADDESYFTRIGVGKSLGIYEFKPGEQSQLLAFGVYAEGCRTWAKEQRAALGL
jgi:hypothetical protein